MEIKVKKKNRDGIVRLESRGLIKEVYIDEDFEKENVNICFRGKASSGIITLSPSEIESIYNLIKDKTHLVTGFKEYKIGKGNSPI